MTRTVLLTLGRLPKGLDLARSFHRSGYRVIVAEPFRWHLMRVSNAVSRCYQVTAPAADPERYLGDLAQIVEKEAVTLVVPISEEVLHVAALRDRLPPEVQVFTPGQREILALHNKYQFIKTARKFGLDVPETYRCGTRDAEALAKRSRTVVKPIFSCAGSGVSFLQKGDVPPAIDPARPMIVQARVEGDAISSFSLAHEGNVQLTTLYRGVIMTGTVAVGFERVRHQPVIEDWIRKFVEQTGYSGFIAFDFIISDDGRAFAIECNPRVTSGVHFVSTESLAPMMLGPDEKTSPPDVTHRRLHQFWPCLTETQTSVFKPGRFRRHLRHLLQAKDVTWKRNDPLPFLLMPFTSMKMLWMAMTTDMTLGEAATRDIEWEPDANCVDSPTEPDITKTEASPGT